MASATELRQLHGDVTRDKRTVPGETTLSPARRLCTRPELLFVRRVPDPRGLGTLIRSEIQHGVIEPCSRFLVDRSTNNVVVSGDYSNVTVRLGLGPRN